MSYQELESLSKSSRLEEVCIRYDLALLIWLNNITGELYITHVTRNYAFTSTISTNSHSTVLYS